MKPMIAFARRLVPVITLLLGIAGAKAQVKPPAAPAYTVPPGGLVQFPVRQGPASDDYVELEKLSGIGLTVPDSPLLDVHRKPITLSHYRGKVIVLDFWGTTCGPCLREMPRLASLTRIYHGQNVVFLAVCESSHDWTRFVRQAAVFSSADLRFALDPLASDAKRSLRGQLHNGMGQPTQLIVEGNGRVAGALQGYDDALDPDLKQLQQSIDVALRKPAISGT